MKYLFLFLPLGWHQMFKNILSFCLLIMVSVVLISCSDPGIDDDNNTIDVGIGDVPDDLNPQDDDIGVVAPVEEAINADLQAYKDYLYDPFLVDGCESCHIIGGNYEPLPFADSDVSLALSSIYENNLINKLDPGASLLVLKVASGHFCWDGRANCAKNVAELVSAITLWASLSLDEEGEPVDDPIEVIGEGEGEGEVDNGNDTDSDDTGNGDTGDDDVDFEAISEAAFAQFVYRPILQEHLCKGCHIEGSNYPYAHSDSNVAIAYIFAKPFISLSDPAGSVFVNKVGEGHFCWGGDCDASAVEFEEAIVAMASAIEAAVGSPIDGESGQGNGAVNLMTYVTPEAIFGQSEKDTRDNSNAIALYSFLEGEGTVVTDLSGYGLALNLDLQGNAQWIPGGGVKFLAGSKAVASAQGSTKLYDAIAGDQGSNEYSIEAWIRADSDNQSGPARIVTYSSDANNRNFTLGQNVDYLDWRNRTTNPDVSNNGVPSFNNPGFISANTELNHVVATYDQVNGRQIFWNNQLIPGDDDTAAASLANWDESYIFGLANETNDIDRQWLGQTLFVAVYNKALSASQVAVNFDAGVGEKFRVSFDISSLVKTPETFIVMEASELGGQAYSFAKPTLITSAPTAINAPLSGVRIAVNDVISNVGQSFSELNEILTTNGQIISAQGAVFKSAMGKELDTFKLAFEIIGDNTNIFVEQETSPVGVFDDGEPATQVQGVRNFDKINDTMSAVTGISKNKQTIAEVFEGVKTSFPVSSAMVSFVSSHQVAISKLSLEYCDALVHDISAREAFFGGVNFDEDVSVALNTSGVSAVVNALWVNIVGTGMENQPDESAFKDEVGGMMVDLIAHSPDADASRTRSIVIGACTAVLGSSLSIVH